MSFERRSRIPRTLLVVVSVLVVLAAVQALFVPTSQAAEKPHMCVVQPDGYVAGCPPIPNPFCGGCCYAVGCNGGGCVYQCTCPIP